MINFTLGVVLCCPPKTDAKMLKKAMGSRKLSASEGRSRRNAAIAVRTMAKINRAAPFQSGTGKQILNLVGAAKHPPTQDGPLRSPQSAPPLPCTPPSLN